MPSLILFGAMGVLFLIIGFVNKRRKEASEKRDTLNEQGLKEVPWVPGCLPLLGHSIALGDMSGFLQKCYEKYGKIFKIRMFRVTLVVVADRSLSMEFFKAKEDQLSFYGMLNRIYLGKAFEMPALTMENMMALVKKSIVLKMDTVLPKMHQEAQQLMKSLQEKAGNNKNMDFTRDVMRYVANTSSRCFIGIPLTDEMFDDLYTFTQILNKTLVGSYLIPVWAIKMFIQPRLNRLNKKISLGYYEEINKYREDKKKNSSLLLRLAVDSKHQTTGEPLTNEEIANIIVCLLYISSENTALGLVNSILDLAKHPEHWEKARAEAANLQSNNDWKGVINSRYLHSCVMESARVNSHAFAVERKPAGKVSLGDYYIGDADAVAMGEILLHTHGAAENVFSTPTTYNPDRFVREENKESAGSLSVVTWGAGLHACPGKVFAQYEIKMGIALFLLNFKFDMNKTSIGPKDYFSPSAFSERKLFARILPIQ